MPDLVVIFTTPSDIEARVVQSLLEAHGLMAIASSGMSRAVFPLSVDRASDVKIAVHESEVEEARRIIDSHRTELKNGEVVRLRDEFDALERAIQYRFRDRGLLEQAMTHTSRANEDPSGGVADNESLEFLGDALLGFVIADQLFRDFPMFDEGEKSKSKAALVSTTTLARQAERLQLGDHLLLGRGEEKTGGRRKQALLADGYEALIAAIYLDGGIEHARAFIGREFAPLMAGIGQEGVAGHDYKSALQELLQARELPLPDYRLMATLGPDHQKQFQVEVVVDGQALGQATGASKKEAEQEAARAALGAEGPGRRRFRQTPRTATATRGRLVQSETDSSSHCDDRDRVVGRFPFGFELARSRLHRGQIGAVLRDEHGRAHLAVARDDARRVERRQPIERTNPRFDARVRTRKGDEGPVHDDIAGEQHAFAFDERHRVAARVRRSQRQQPHPDAAEIDGVFAVEDDVGFAELRAVEQLLHRR